MQSREIVSSLIKWFDYRKLYSTTNEEVSGKSVLVRCLTLSLFLGASLFCKWFCIPLLVLALVFVAFENGMSKLAYVAFMLPFYNCFRLERNQLYWVAYLLLAVVLLLGIQILIKYIKKETKVPWIKLAIFAAIAAYFVFPLRPISLTVAITMLANIGLFAVCLLGEWKKDFKLFVRVFVVGLIIASVFGLFFNHIPRIPAFVGMFEAGLSGVYRFCGLDADPNYYSMGIILSLSLYTLLYFKNKITIKEFIIVIFVLTLFGFMTISKSYYIILAVFLLALIAVIIYKNWKNWKRLAKSLVAVCFALFLSATASASYINFTFDRINWNFKFLQSYDKVIFDIGDALSGLNQLKIEKETGVSVGGTNNNSIKENNETIVEIPSMTVLTTGRSDIWKAYLSKVKNGSAKEILFGTNAKGQYISVEGQGTVATHNTVVQVLYYYGVAGLLIIVAIVGLLALKGLKKYKLCVVNLLPVFLYCIDIMALDNLTSMRTPIFVYLLALSLFYDSPKKEPDVFESEDKVSVIVPVYNASKTLDKCVKSLIKQTYNNLEIILIDDGSKDNSLKICEGYAKQDSRIIVKSKPNGGVSHTRNTGIEMATGKYISFIDSDDYIEPDFIETLYKGIQNFDLAMCGYNVVDVELLKVVKLGKNTLSKENFNKVIDLYYKNDTINAPWNKLFKSELISGKFQQGLSLGEDLLFNLNYLDGCKSINVLDYVGHNYVQMGAGSLTGKYNKEKFETIIFIYKSCLEKYNSNSNKVVISSVLIRNICGQLRKFFKSKELSKQTKLEFVKAYMERPEVKEALSQSKASGLAQKISFYLLKKKRYSCLYYLYKFI